MSSYYNSNKRKRVFNKAVTEKSHEHWGEMLSTLENPMRSWCASIIWWCHGANAPEDSDLFKYMEEYRNNQINSTQQIGEAMQAIGLIAPPIAMSKKEIERMENRTTHSARRREVSE